MKTYPILIFMLLTSPLLSAELSTEQQEIVNEVIQQHIHTTHKTLDKKKLKISLFTIDNPEYFFISNFGVKRALLGSKKYRIGVNPLVFEKSIPEDALKGVLAHELIHTEDYESGSTLGTILPIGVKVTFKKSRIQYERKTDLKVIQKGLYKELIAYKKWQYPLLSPSALKNKKVEYLTPEEVLFAKEILNNDPELFNSWLKGFTPRELLEFKLSKALKEGNFQKQDDSKIKKKKELKGHNSYRYSMLFQNDSDKDCFLNVYPFSNDKIKWKRKKSFLAPAKTATQIGWKQFGGLRKVVIAPQNCPLAGTFFSYSH